ncbi:amidohydrolase family protein [Homoserinibacter sp. YIM 151385]|uniref:amidohydrolase family protein n=1 Tax=Homoserinibacter sp. YIM 151385 TaxID=2985506 RepID=UPI0022F0100E|nr:amidohydrolase family protein [Homoserinibacter sp. YIM 151385]WBU36756.1 amidohydrolase family protein [Homoserinibacter sp. YIM 151385]
MRTDDQPDQPDAFARLQHLPVVEWTPVAQLRPPETEVRRTAVPAVDIHNHLGRWLSGGDWQQGTAPWIIDDVDALLKDMDDCGIQTIVNLDGMWGEEVTANVERYDRAHPGRFLTFCQLDWARLAEDDGVDALRASLEDSAARGARGVKVWKSLGLTVRDRDGQLVLPDDPRVIAVLGHAGELGLPVLIHTADPKAFFEPLDERNERLDELLVARDWWFGDRAVHPSFERLLEAHAALVAACPGTDFIGAHFGCAAEDLDLVERMLAANPNYHVDIAGRMAELGRQPRRVRALIERFPDRVLFGTDIYPAEAEQFRLHARFLETLDEAFSYAPGADIPPQGRWSVSALGLPPELLEPVYRGNAARILGLG